MKNRVVIVSGSASGIGNAVVQLLVAENAHVVGGDITPQSDQRAGSFLPVEVDLRSQAGGEQLVEAALAEYGRVDGLVNCVGVQFNRRDGFDQITDDDWLTSFELNFASAVRAIRAALPTLTAQRSGSIVSIGSVAAGEPLPHHVDYAAFKAALTATSKALATELAKFGVRVNTISPGPTDTPQFRRWFDEHRPGDLHDVEDRMRRFASEERRVPLGRLGATSEVADAVVFLLSDRASNVTGANLRVDGGVTRAP